MMIHQTLSRGGVLLSGLVLGATLAALPPRACGSRPEARIDVGERR